ncbi:hypothetical protein BKP35_07040 [Anaerobacillus arseniciselenatis]|uniref:Uncharacterized protein n=1 Tax=Anaerobacillus arseniciselenatis TaxID=85682 RepID=A0A1S2LNZ6_9BACI|nr:hypothetical protein [Anaerobacillus arseniciselenatis]OIJ14249.1 hypothetical protein BKP35_07040 [Anaerobacillus arseniciselenatis]
MSHIKKIWREKIYQNVEVQHKNYQVTYCPIKLKSEFFATLQLVFKGKPKADRVAETMEKELEKWVTKFPLPLLIIPLDEDDNTLSLNEVKPNDYLLGYYDNENNRVIKTWEEVKKEDVPSDQLSDEYIDKVYKKLPFTNREENEKQADEKVKEMKNIKRFFDSTLYSWLIISITILILGLKSNIVAGIAFAYSLFKVIKRYLEIKGYKTKKQREKAEIQRKMKHYYYHCEMNPRAFEALKSENLHKMQK